MDNTSFEQNLQRYADLIVEVGLNLQPDQGVIIAAGLESVPLVRAIAAKAYQKGAPRVDVTLLDEELTRIRFEHAPRDSFEEYPVWIMEARVTAIKKGDAYLQVFGRDPELLKEQDPELVAALSRVISQHYKPVGDEQGVNSVQWALAAVSSPTWASKVFPDLSPKDAEKRLWEEIFKVCRLDRDDPKAAWNQHLDELNQRSQYLTDKQYIELRYTAPGTDLKVGLPEGHIWESGGGVSQKGVYFVANLPTEEVYTMPHKDRVEGVVASSRPLAYRGSLIDNFSLTFKDGKVVDLSAKVGEDVLRKMVETDENAGRLGEVALVPHGSPISQSGIVFYNTLFDENASCHLALGSAYHTNLSGGDAMSDEEFAEAGGNDSLIHVDFMIGSGEMDIDGITKESGTEPVMRAGEWAFDV